MYHHACDWCGERINTTREQYVELAVEIVTLETERIREQRVRETEPTRFFHVTPLRSRDEWDRLGLDIEVRSDDLGDCCYTRALRAIEGNGFDEPDAGLEWRLVPVGATVSEPSAGEAEPCDKGVLAEPLWEPGYPRNDGSHTLRYRDDLGLGLWRGGPASFNVHRLRNHCTTVGDLKRAVDERTLLDVPGIGPKTFEWIKKELEAFLRKASARERAVA